MSFQVELNNDEALSSLSPDALDTIHSKFGSMFYSHIVSGDYFEINALYNVLVADMPAFEEAISGLKS